MTELTKAQLKLAGLEIADTFIHTLYRLCLSVIGCLLEILALEVCDAFGVLETGRAIFIFPFILIILPNTAYQCFKILQYGKEKRERTDLITKSY